MHEHEHHDDGSNGGLTTVEFETKVGFYGDGDGEWITVARDDVLNPEVRI